EGGTPGVMPARRPGSQPGGRARCRPRCCRPPRPARSGQHRSTSRRVTRPGPGAPEVRRPSWALAADHLAVPPGLRRRDPHSLTATGFTARAALASATGTDGPESGQTAAALRDLQGELFTARRAVNMLASNVNQAAAACYSTGTLP